MLAGRASTAAGVLVVSCTVGMAVKTRSLQQGDGTAQGVAKARHMETIYPLTGASHPQKRLFEDPYAQHLYFGSSATALLLQWVSPETLFGLIGSTQAAVQLTLVGRTAEFDRQVRAAVEAGCKQLVILGAGYDTRGLRLGLPEDVAVFEVDQPGVQERKRAKLSRIPALTTILSSGRRERLHFVAVDFDDTNATEDGIASKLASHPAYDPAAPTVFTLEGVTQYITKEATVATLAAAARVSGPGSRIAVSYVPEGRWDAPETRAVRWMADTIAGEPWVAGWEAAELAAVMWAQGFAVERDVALPELNGEYFVPAGRPVPEEHQVILERFATAVKT